MVSKYSNRILKNYKEKDIIVPKKHLKSIYQEYERENEEYEQSLQPDSAISTIM